MNCIQCGINQTSKRVNCDHPKCQNCGSCQHCNNLKNPLESSQMIIDSTQKHEFFSDRPKKSGDLFSKSRKIRGAPMKVNYSAQPIVLDPLIFCPLSKLPLTQFDEKNGTFHCSHCVTGLTEIGPDTQLLSESQQVIREILQKFCKI